MSESALAIHIHTTLSVKNVPLQTGPIIKDYHYVFHK
jgi:hypothetical protein